MLNNPAYVATNSPVVQQSQQFINQSIKQNVNSDANTIFQDSAKLLSMAGAPFSQQSMGINTNLAVDGDALIIQNWGTYILKIIVLSAIILIIFQFYGKDLTNMQKMLIVGMAILVFTIFNYIYNVISSFNGSFCKAKCGCSQ